LTSALLSGAKVQCQQGENKKNANNGNPKSLYLFVNLFYQYVLVEKKTLMNKYGDSDKNDYICTRKLEKAY